MPDHSVLVDLLLLGFAIVVTFLVANFIKKREEDKWRREKNLFLQTLIDSIPSPIFYKDTKGKYLGCNSAFSSMLGIEVNEIVGKTVYDLSPRELAEVYEKADNALFAAGGSQRYETQVKSVDGVVHEVYFIKSLFKNIDGEVAGLLGVMLDITDRKRSEEALKQAHDELELRVEERTVELGASNLSLEREVAERMQAEQESRAKSEFLDSVINSINHGLVVVDIEDFSVKLANAAAADGRMFEGLCCHKLLHDSDVVCGNDICPLHAVKKTGKPAVAQHDHVNSDGSVTYVEIHAYPVFDQKGKLIQVIENIMDITSRKEAEQAMLEAKEMAETTSRLMSEFLDMVSHELRTPMTSVQGFAKLIDKAVRKNFEPLAEDDERLMKPVMRIEENLGIIMSESGRLTELISDHLDLSKLESGRVEWRHEKIVPAELIDRTRAATQTLYQEDSVELVVEVEDDLPVFEGDPDRLLQVMINLVSNAVKFTQEGTVTCAVIRQDDGLLFCVSDTGIGIPEDQLELVFSKFSQLQTKKSGKPSGTGLGLPISREIITHHKGEIWVESELGKGSRFCFFIPVK
ncbi:ATP-binding protein [uncultured Pseudodesulfovibrio sp.]|uniref:ATP-binding protein n=1 Tax=uncultured Pseudodesulfovibrio sp. TaxID=2035858 RepID=UPI0029C980C7|nr:ATP-binding protein [uncultured Pseudodesulfovibrio sp.]